MTEQIIPLIQSLCEPDGPCNEPRVHLSTDCFPQYWQLENDGLAPDLMD
mgnify:CR=1 FL=1